MKLREVLTEGTLDITPDNVETEKAKAIENVRTAKQERNKIRQEIQSSAGVIPSHLRDRLTRAENNLKVQQRALDTIDARLKAFVMSRDSARELAKELEARGEREGTGAGEAIGQGIVHANELRDTLGGWGGLAQSMLTYVKERIQRQQPVGIEDVANEYGVKPRTIYNWLHLSDFEPIAKLMNIKQRA